MDIFFDGNKTESLSDLFRIKKGELAAKFEQNR